MVLNLFLGTTIRTWHCYEFIIALLSNLRPTHVCFLAAAASVGNYTGHWRHGKTVY